MKSVADRVREADTISHNDEGELTFYDIINELKILYLNDDVEGLRDLYGAFCEMETRSSGNDNENIYGTVLNYLDWFSQIADATIKLGRNDIEFNHFGHSKRLTGPVCDFFRQMTGYEPNF